jgi:hypothetical protein
VVDIAAKQIRATRSLLRLGQAEVGERALLS